MSARRAIMAVGRHNKTIHKSDCIGVLFISWILTTTQAKYYMQNSSQFKCVGITNANSTAKRYAAQCEHVWTTK